MSGSKAWTRLIGSTNTDEGYSVSTGADGSVYIGGITYGDIDGHANRGGVDAFLTKFNSDGSKVWTQLIGTSSGDKGLSISPSADGSVYVTGDEIELVKRKW